MPDGTTFNPPTVRAYTPQYPTHYNNDEDNMTDTTILQTTRTVIKPKIGSRFPAYLLKYRSRYRCGNDLHHRGYDILDPAEHREFEEVAHLPIHGNYRPATSRERV